ncbi:NAD(+) synthase [Mycoplasma sp. 4044]
MKIQEKTLKEIQQSNSYSQLVDSIDKLQEWLVQNLKHSNQKGYVLGLSGGIDSSTLAMILDNKPELKNNHFYSITINDSLSDKPNLSDVKQLENQLCTKVEYVDLTQAYLDFKKSLNTEDKLVLANLKARMRMVFLYAKAQENNALVLGTDNANEYHLGYFTKYGDGACDLLPLSNFLKSEIYQIAMILGVPDSIVHKKPSADLWEGQNDEDEMGFSYDEFEEIALGNGNGSNFETIVKRIKINRHKVEPIKQFTQTPNYKSINKNIEKVIAWDLKNS